MSSRTTAIAALVTAVWPVIKWVYERRDKREDLEARVAKLEAELKSEDEEID